MKYGLINWLGICLIVIALSIFVALMPSHKNVGNEGFWHLQNKDNVWWFVSPKGDKQFMNMVQTVNPKQESMDPNGPHFESKDYKGDLDLWAVLTADRIKSWGFKGVGAWSNPALHSYIPFSRDLNLTKWTHHNIEDEEWESEIEKAIIIQVSHLKNEKNLIGYYTDNEMDWIRNEQYAEKYFEVTSRLLKKYDPNHLNLGVRYNLRPPISVIKASKGRIDANSVNQYLDTPQAYKNMIREIFEITGRPIIITEFSFIAPDGLSGNKNLKWAGYGRVATRDQRAYSYSAFVEGIASTSFIIGCDWFQFNDEPPAGRGDGEDMNCGIVSVYDEEYPEMIDAVRRSSARVNQIHENSTPDQLDVVWRNDPIR